MSPLLRSLLRMQLLLIVLGSGPSMRTGRPIPVALVTAVSAFLVSDVRAMTLYATDRLTQSLYTIATDTHAIGLVGPYTLALPDDEEFIGGTSFDRGGVLYGVSSGFNAALYTLDPASAATTFIGSLGLRPVTEGGLAFDPTSDVLYAVNLSQTNQSNLMTIDVSTGQATSVGLIAGGNHDFAGLVFDASGQLYAADRVTNALWKIDKSAPGGPGTTQVGGFSGGIQMGPSGGMTNDRATGLVHLYASGSRHLCSVNLATGNATILHQFALTDPVFYSLATPGEFITAVGVRDPRLAPLRVAPNPSRRAVAFEFELRDDDRVTLVILDVQGRRIRTLMDGRRSAGSHQVSWDGLDKNGLAMGPGAYFARIETSEAASVRPLVRIR